MRKRRESNIHRIFGAHLVNQMRQDLRFQNQMIVFRDHIHDLLPALNHTAHGLVHQPKHLALHWRAHLGPRQIGLDGIKAFFLTVHRPDHLGQLGLNLFGVLVLTHTNPLHRLLNRPAELFDIGHQI